MYIHSKNIHEIIVFFFIDLFLIFKKRPRKSWLLNKNEYFNLFKNNL